MVESDALLSAIILLLAAVVAVPLVRRLHVSPVLGYLLAGIVVGPHALGLVADSEGVRHLADFGVVFLLFAVGLELSVERLTVMRRLVFGLGLAQMALSAVVLGAIAHVAGLPAPAALVVGVALAMSSTAVVVQLLAERNETASHVGRAAIAVLLLQDLLVVPMLVLIPLLSGDESSLLGALGLAAVKAALALAAILIAGPWLLRPLLHFVAGERSADLFAAVTLLAVLGTAWLTGIAGLSLPLGAFLAGVVLADTEFRHQVAAEIQAFRGLLLGLFFMTVGMTIEIAALLDSAPQVAAAVGGLILVKTLALAGPARLFGVRPGAAWRVGLLLAEGGEFAFVLLTLAVAAGVVAGVDAQFLGLAVALSMVLTPGLAALGRFAERRVHNESGEAALLEREARDLAGHVLILGFGRVGRTVAALLERAGQPYLALDHDPGSVHQARAQKKPVFYGSAERPQLLRACRLAQARAVVVTLDQAGTSERAVETIRGLAPVLPILARGRDHEHAARLTRAGATEVVMEMTEASLALGGKALVLVGEAAEAIDMNLRSERAKEH